MSTENIKSGVAFTCDKCGEVWEPPAGKLRAGKGGRVPRGQGQVEDRQRRLAASLLDVSHLMVLTSTQSRRLIPPRCG